MQKIPFFTLGLWLLTLAGYFLMPEILLLPAVKYPLLLLLTTTLTLSFWLDSQGGKRLRALAFIGILGLNMALPVVGFFQLQGLRGDLDRTLMNQADPEMVRLIVSGLNQTEREMAARVLFHRHGLILPYGSVEDGFTLFNPTGEDKKNWMAQLDQNTRLDNLRMNLDFQQIEMFFLCLLQMATFSLLLVYLCLRQSGFSMAGDRSKRLASGENHGL